MNEIKVGLIGGSGLGQLLAERAQGAAHAVETPFGPPSDQIVEMQWEGLTVYFLSRHGPGHMLNPSQVPYRANIYAMKKLGVTHIIASGAVGSLREEFKPRDLVVPDQIIDKTHKRANTFYERAAVHVEFAEPFDAVLRRMLVEEGSGFGVQGSGVREGEAPAEPSSSRASGPGSAGALPSQATSPAQPEPRTLNPEPSSEPSFTTHSRGCYVCMEGPAFSTRAESLMHRLWGGDLIGMTCMPEAKLAREAEIAYALVALVTDYDCWRKPQAPKEAERPVDPAELLKEIIANLQAASDNAASLIGRTLRRIAADPQALAASPALGALKLAIWSDKARIPRDQVELLAPLWMKYFGESA
jgi:5'-methylthioadenosine phosphorylase